MVAAKRYATAAEYQLWARSNQARATGDEQNAQEMVIENLLDSCSRIINSYTNNFFWLVQNRTVSGRTDYGGFQRILRTDPITAITSVKVNDRTLTAGTDYRREWELTDDPMVDPSFKLVTIGDKCWPSLADYEIVGDFGYSNVPKGIKIAVMLMVNKLRYRPTNPTGIQDGMFIARYDPDVNALLNPYCRGRAV